MRRVVLGLLGALLAASLVVLAVLLRGGPPVRDAPASHPTAAPLALPPLALEPRVPVFAEHILLTRDDDRDGQWDALFVVEAGEVRRVSVPDGVDRTADPASDGARVYLLRTREGGAGRGRAELVALSPDTGEEAPVSGSTPLVVPRSVHASPKGDVIAYFLDSTRGSRTELWTYDPARERTRLAIERLSRSAVGPFWEPDGGFIVRDGKTIIRGTPHRTGGEALDVDRPAWDDVPAGETMIPSPGGTQVTYVTRAARPGTLRATLRVWDLGEGGEREVFTVPDRDVRILGWGASGALVLAAGKDPVTLWDVRKEGQQSFAVEGDVSSVILAGDGTTLAYVRDAEDGSVLVTMDAERKDDIALLPLPVASPPSPDIRDAPERAGARAPRPAYRLIQFLRRPVLSGDEALASGETLANEDVVRYAAERIREIAEAPEAEPVAAERVWLTRVPGVVYVDYRIGTTLWRRLVRIDGDGGMPDRHAVLGVFAPAAGEWILMRGSDLADGRSALLYEFEPEIERWVRKGSGADVHP